MVRLSAIGDVIHTLPVLCALRERFPESAITWVVEQRAAAVLVGHSALDELITLPRGFLRSPAGVWKLRQRLRAAHYDLAIDAQGLSKSAVVAWLSGARRRIGFGRPWGRELSRWLNQELVDTFEPHAVDRNLELLRPLGVIRPPVRFDVPEPPSARAAAENLLRQLGLQERFVVVAPGAGWASKRWPVERFAAVAEHLARDWQMPTLAIWGNAQEELWAAQIAHGAGGRGRVAPRCSLAELAAIFRRASFCLGGDSGPLHLAAAVGTPCVGLYGPWPAEKHGPYGPAHITVQRAVCHGTTRQRRHASGQYIQAIRVDDACRACDEMLSRLNLKAA